MEEVFRTNDLVKLSYIKHLLSEEGIEPFVLDEHTAMIDGRGPMVPIRITVARGSGRAGAICTARCGEGCVTETTVDDFYDGRVKVVQPVQGFRAGTDSLLLAAALRADFDGQALEIGCGAGGALLTAAFRLPAARLTGLEIDPCHGGPRAARHRREWISEPSRSGAGQRSRNSAGLAKSV